MSAGRNPNVARAMWNFGIPGQTESADVRLARPMPQPHHWTRRSDAAP
jgi:hypothetical protein